MAKQTVVLSVIKEKPRHFSHAYGAKSIQFWAVPNMFHAHRVDFRGRHVRPSLICSTVSEPVNRLLVFFD
jgi:hypothetical protein